MSVIYGLTETGSSDIRYVGKTTKTPEHRLARHIWHARERNGISRLYVSSWIRSCAYHVSVGVLERDPQDASKAEREWIARLRASGARLTNLTDGGEGMSGYRLSLEHRAAISAANHRRFSDPAARARISEANRQRGPEAAAKMNAARRLEFRWSDEAKAEMSAKRRGKPKSPETRERIAAANRARGAALRGTKLSEETKAKIRATTQTPEYRARCRESWRRRKEALPS